MPNSDTSTADGWEWRANYSSPPCAGGSTCGELIDERDGKHYRTVTIGGQTWLAESLNFGVRRALADPPAESGPSTKSCAFDSELWCARIGARYFFHEAMALPARCDQEECSALLGHPHRGICPVGWHIPSGQEFLTLLAAVGNTEPSTCNTATALRATQGWQYEDIAASATDSSGFSVFPQNLLKSAGTYWGTITMIWSADSFATPAAARFHKLELRIADDCAHLVPYYAVSNTAETVRCIKD